MAEQSKKVATRSAEKQSKLVMPIIVACSLAISACVAFGSPALWTLDTAPNPEGTSSSESNGSAFPFETNKSGIDDTKMEVVGEYKAISQSEDAERTYNLSLATQALNGYEIKPGETFSFNNVVGDTENNPEYRIAPVVFGNEMTYARGGGICQVSTALYIAALKSDMEIVERHPHSLATDYASIGLDATLVYGVMDLQLKNTSEYPLYISAEAVGQTVTVKLYGHSLGKGVSIDATSKIVDRLDEQGNKQGTSSDNSTSATFYVVESYRVYFKDGVAVEQQHLYTDTYEVYKNSTVTLGEGGVDPTK